MHDLLEQPLHVVVSQFPEPGDQALGLVEVQGFGQLVEYETGWSWPFLQTSNMGGIGKNKNIPGR